MWTVISVSLLGSVPFFLEYLSTSRNPAVPNSIAAVPASTQNHQVSYSCTSGSPPSQMMNSSLSSVLPTAYAVKFTLRVGATALERELKATSCREISLLDEAVFSCGKTYAVEDGLMVKDANTVSSNSKLSTTVTANAPSLTL